jgi:thiamine pyrophosphate-dependent acetolactate synthase large subunit-like protein
MPKTGETPADAALDGLASAGITDLLGLTSVDMLTTCDSIARHDDMSLCLARHERGWSTWPTAMHAPPGGSEWL